MPRGKTHKSGEHFDDWVPLGVFNLRIFHTEPPAIHQLYLRFPSPSTVSQRALCSCVSVTINCHSLYSSAWLSKFGGSGLPCDLTSLMDLRTVVDF